MTRTSRAIRIPAPARRNTAFRRGRSLAATVVAGVLLAGCGSDKDAPPTPGGTPKQGGSLTMTVPGDAASFDPAQTSFVAAADGNRMSAVYDALVVTDPATGTVQPQIAERLAPDGNNMLQWNLTIKPNVTFSDGTPYDANAVKVNWDRHRDISIGSFQSMAAINIKTLAVDAANPLLLHISLNTANANFDRIVARNLAFIASPKALADPGKLRDHPVGAGPFMLKEWVPGQKQVFVKNPNYWQKDKGLPYLDEIVINVDMDVKRGVESLGKSSDLMVTVDPANIGLGKSKGLGVEELHLNGGAMVLFNNLKGPFTDVRARQAVAYALSGAEINDKFYNGAGTPAKGIFGSTSPLANNQVSAPENNGDKAKELFDQVTKNGTKPLQFTYITPAAPTTVDVARFIQQKLSAYRGVEMKIQQVDIATYIRTVRKGGDGWTAAVGQQWIDDPEPGIYDLLHGGMAAFGNSAGYDNATVNKALDEARLTTDTGERRDAYTRVQTQLNEDMPFWVYQEAVSAALFTPKVTGLQLFNDGLVRWELIGLRK